MCNSENAILTPIHPIYKTNDTELLLITDMRLLLQGITCYHMALGRLSDPGMRNSTSSRSAWWTKTSTVSRYVSWRRGTTSCTSRLCARTPNRSTWCPSWGGSPKGTSRNTWGLSEFSSRLPLSHGHAASSPLSLRSDFAPGPSASLDASADGLGCSARAPGLRSQYNQWGVPRWWRILPNWTSAQTQTQS